MIEKEIQDYYLKMCQKYCIDFLRLKNQGFKGKMASSKSYGVFKEGSPNDKYFPDMIFVFMGKVFMREFSMRDGKEYKNPERKKKQWERMKHWQDNGHCDILIVDSLELAEKDWQAILGNKSLEVV